MWCQHQTRISLGLLWGRQHQVAPAELFLPQILVFLCTCSCGERVPTRTTWSWGAAFWPLSPTIRTCTHHYPRLLIIYLLTHYFQVLGCPSACGSAVSAAAAPGLGPISSGSAAVAAPGGAARAGGSRVAAGAAAAALSSSPLRREGAGAVRGRCKAGRAPADARAGGPGEGGRREGAVAVLWPLWLCGTGWE